MKKKPIFLVGLAGVLTLAVMLPAGAEAGKASAKGVEPVEISGNPDCTTVGSEASNDFKYEPVSAGKNQTFTLGTDVTLSLDISNDKRILDFAIEGAVMHDVIVKAGASANLYHYEPAVKDDKSLHGPIQRMRGPNEQYYEISHVSFCWDFKVNAAPVATDQTENIDYTEDTSGKPNPHDIVLDASDPDDDPLTVVTGSLGPNGATSAGGSVVVKSIVGDTVTVTYTPPKDFTGSDSFEYTVSDGEFTASATVTVQELLDCGQTVEVKDGDVSAKVTHLETPDCKQNPYILDIVSTSSATDSEIPTIRFIPGENPVDCSIISNRVDGACTDQYIGELTFEPLAVSNPPATGTIEYDPVPREDPADAVFRDMQWCKADPLAGATLTIDQILPNPVGDQGESWCIISATTTTAGDGKTVTTWLVYGIGDPLKRIS